MRKNKVEWCDNFIKKTFAKYSGGIEVGFFWNMAEKSRLWERGTYGSPMSQALEKLTTVKAVKGDNGEILFYVFELK